MARTQSLKKQSGQVIIEYVLILVVLVTIGTFIVSRMIGRDPQEPGFVIANWNAIAQVIASDNPDSNNNPKFQ